VSAATDGHDLVNGQSRYCPKCAHVVYEDPYCPGCGHPLPGAVTAAASVSGLIPPVTAANTASLLIPQYPPLSAEPSVSRSPTVPPPASVPQPPPTSNRPSRLVAVLIAAALAVVAVAVVGVILVTGSSTNANPAYRQKLAASLMPLVSANRQLSASLQTLGGANVRGAKTAAGQAQTALIATRGAVGILTVPAGSTQVSQQAQQALTQEAGYLQVVSATLADPTSGTAAQLQTVAANTASAFVPLQALVPNAQASISGTDTLSSWARQQSAAAQRAATAAQRRQQQQAIATAARKAAQQTPPSTTTIVVPSPGLASTLAPGTVTGTDSSGHNVGVSCSDNPADPLPGCNDGNGRGPASNLSWGSVTGVDSSGFATGVGCSDNPAIALPSCSNP
jgi:hypothetical protein